MHFLIVVEHGDPAGQDRDSQDAADSGQDPHRAPVASCFIFTLVHPLLEIAYYFLVNFRLCPGHVLAQDHIILHHLIAFVVDTVSPQLIKSI